MSPDRKEPTAEERAQFFNLKAMKEGSTIFLTFSAAIPFTNEVIFKNDSTVNTPIDMLIVGSSTLGVKLIVHGLIEPAIRRTIRTIRKKNIDTTGN